MEGNYEVKFGSQAVGKVQVFRQGLYYHFVCRCALADDVVSRLVVRCGNRNEKIGVLIPSGDGLSLDKKLPVKIFGDEEPEFYLAPRHDTVNGKFVPIYPEEPFAYIARLKDAFLVTQNGQVGAMLKTMTEVEYNLM